MKTFILSAILAISSGLCVAADEAKPITIIFSGPTGDEKDWIDKTEYPESHPRDPQPAEWKDGDIGYLTIPSDDSSERKYSWRVAGEVYKDCTVVLTGDPKVSMLRFNLQDSFFDRQDNDNVDLSVVHLRCGDSPGAVGIMSEPAFSLYDTLEDTDFEQPLAIYFVATQETRDTTFWGHSNPAPSPEEVTYDETLRSELASIYVGAFGSVRYNAEPRKFLWSPDSAAHKQCYLNVNYDPHVGAATVELGKDGPKVLLERGLEDDKAITVFCEEQAADDRPLGKPLPGSRR